MALEEYIGPGSPFGRSRAGRSRVGRAIEEYAPVAAELPGAVLETIAEPIIGAARFGYGIGAYPFEDPEDEARRNRGEATGGASPSKVEQNAIGAVGKAAEQRARPIDKPPVDATVTPGSERAPNATMTAIEEALAKGRAAGETRRPGEALSFAWGGGKPEGIPAGILGTRLSPTETGRPTIDSMVRDPMSGTLVQAHESRGGGGFSPSQMDWSKVANPWGFEDFRRKAAAAGAPEDSTPEVVAQFEKVREGKITAALHEEERQKEQEQASKDLGDLIASIEKAGGENEASGGQTGRGMDGMAKNEAVRRAILAHYARYAPGRLAEAYGMLNPQEKDPMAGYMMQQMQAAAAAKQAGKAPKPDAG